MNYWDLKLSAQKGWWHTKSKCIKAWTESSLPGNNSSNVWLSCHNWAIFLFKKQASSQGKKICVGLCSVLSSTVIGPVCRWRKKGYRDSTDALVYPQATGGGEWWGAGRDAMSPAPHHWVQCSLLLSLGVCHAALPMFLSSVTQGPSLIHLLGYNLFISTSVHLRGYL